MKTIRYSGLIIMALLALTGCHSDKEQQQAVTTLSPIEVQAFPISAAVTRPQTEVVGTVRSVNQAVIAAKVTGTLTDAPVLLGSVVKKGDLLIKISAGEISARAVQTRTQMEQARRNLEREKKLLKKNAATSENVKSLEDMFRVAEAVHREAATMLSYTTIRAPFDGVITSKMANVGDLATPGTPLLRLEDGSRLQVETSVPEALVLEVQQGENLQVHVPAAKLEIMGTVAEVAPVADPQSRTGTIKINIDSDPRLHSGQFARVSIPGPVRQSIFVPSSAVHPFGQMDRVFVIDDNRARLRLVRTGTTTKEQTEILAGLEPGETIAITSGSPPVDGQPVTILP